MLLGLEKLIPSLNASLVALAVIAALVFCSLATIASPTTTSVDLSTEASVEDELAPSWFVATTVNVENSTLPLATLSFRFESIDVVESSMPKIDMRSRSDVVLTVALAD